MDPKLFGKPSDFFGDRQEWRYFEWVCRNWLSFLCDAGEEWLDQAASAPVELGEAVPDRRETDKALYVSLAMVCGTQDPPPLNDWTPRCIWRQTQLGYRNNSLNGNFSNNISISNSLARATRGRRIHWGPVVYGHGNGSDWCVTAQSNTTTESESMNHQQDWCGNAQSKDKVKDEPVLTGSHVLKEHPLKKTGRRSSRARSGDSGVWH